MKKQGKVWGETARIFAGNNVEIHRIVGKKPGYCSTHLHVHKSNMFWCERGRIQITEWKTDSGTVDKTVLNPGDSCVVPPGSKHMFEVLEDCVAYEIYWVTLDPADIDRDCPGAACKE